MNWVLFFVGLALSALFSAYEMAYVSTEPAVLAARIRGKVGDFLSRQPEAVLVTYLLGINFSNVLAATNLTKALMSFLPDALSAGLGGLVAGFGILLFGEMLPKAISRVAPWVALRLLSGPIYLLFLAFYPLIWPLGRLIGRHEGTEKELEEALSNLAKGALPPEDAEALLRVMRMEMGTAGQMAVPGEAKGGVEVSPDAPGQLVMRILSRGKNVVVRDGERVIGVITPESILERLIAD